MARPDGRFPMEARIPTRHTENTGEQETLDQQTGDQDAGDIPPSPASDHPPPEALACTREADRSRREHPTERRREALARTREADPLTVTKRLQEEGRWFGQIELERNEMMRLAKSRFKTKEERQAWVYSELDRLYPPLEKRTMSSPDAENDAQASQSFSLENQKRTLSYQNGSLACEGGDRQSRSRGDDGQIQGLQDISLIAGRSFPRTHRCPPNWLGFRRTGFGSWRSGRGLRPSFTWTEPSAPLRAGQHWAGWRPASAAMPSSWT